jgi:predicted unusual protein kinase regulating ubiquinone biosynthesis (AarF/ABC1/UbiB family)
MPKQYIETFEPMCMKAPTTNFVDVRAIVEEETGRKLEETFSEFGEKPIASASLGQVHKARLRSTGQIVAVKVQHKWIKEQVPGDLRMIEFGCDVAKKLFPEFKYSWLAEEFRAKLPVELDFRIEAKNAIRCAEIFKNNKRVKVPKIYLELTGERMLTMSFETGISVAHV